MGHPVPLTCEAFRVSKILHADLKKNFPGDFVSREEAVQYQVRGCVSPLTNRSLPFDYRVTDPVTSRRVLLELDGLIGHFGTEKQDQG